MKYNKSEIMKKAWEIKKRNRNNIFGLCLKMAWDEVKSEKDINSVFPEISLSGKTGTEKQKEYAQNLIDAARGTAMLNGIAGYHETDKPGIKRYVSKEDADSYIGAYRMLKNGVDIRKTYGEVIDLVKSQDIVKIAHTIKNEAQKAGKTVNQFVSDMFDRK